MTIKSYAQLKTDIASALPDAGASQITPADVRVGMVDIVDTMQSVSALFPPLKTPVVQAAMTSTPALSGMTATATTGATIDAWLQIALDRQELISVYVHNILASGATGNDCNLTQFDYLCSRIAAFRSTGQMTIAQPSDLV